MKRRIRVSKTSFGDVVYAGSVNKAGNIFLSDRCDVTDDFKYAIVRWFIDTDFKPLIIVVDGNTFVVECKKVDDGNGD
jgi:hypothetical protein